MIIPAAMFGVPRDLSVIYRVVCVRMCRFRKGKHLQFLEDGETDLFIPDDESLKDLLDQSSGSGSGLPLLVRVPFPFLLLLPNV